MATSLRTRLILTFAVLTIIPISIVAVFISQRGFNVLQDQSAAFQNQLAQRTADRLEAFFNERRVELSTLINVFGFGTLDEDTQRSVLSTLLSQQRSYYQFALVGSDGSETLKLTRGEVITDSDLVNRSDDTAIQAAFESGTVSFGSVYFNENARDRLITIAVPIVDLVTGDVEEVLVSEIRFQSIGDTVLREASTEAGQDVFVTDEDGLILAHRNPNFAIRANVFKPDVTSGRTTGLNGDDVILSTHNVVLANQELVIVAQIDYATATSLANDLSNIALIVTLATLVISILIVGYSANQIVKPIIQMSRAAAAIQGGNLEARVSEKGSDEIAALGRSFNRMTADLQTTLKGLRENVTQLEASNQEREKLIKDLQAAKRLAEENSRLKSEFLSTMSHELRTPLNAIEGFTGVVLKRMGGAQFNDKTEDYLKRVQNNSRRLLQLINDFLDLSRVEAGRLELANQPFAPLALAERWKNEIGVLAETKGLTMEVEVSPSMPATLYGDEEAISKVVINLLSNAIKFTETGGIKLKMDHQDSIWNIAVSDTGIGIAPHAREFIFEEFRQVDQSSKRKYGGTGLGLAIVQKYTRVMGGNVSVKSDLGQGSTFTVTLPLKTTA